MPPKTGLTCRRCRSGDGRPCWKVATQHSSAKHGMLPSFTPSSALAVRQHHRDAKHGPHRSNYLSFQRATDRQMLGLHHLRRKLIAAHGFGRATGCTVAAALILPMHLPSTETGPLLSSCRMSGSRLRPACEATSIDAERGKRAGLVLSRSRRGSAPQGSRLGSLHCRLVGRTRKQTLGGLLACWSTAILKIPPAQI